MFNWFTYKRHSAGNKRHSASAPDPTLVTSMGELYLFYSGMILSRCAMKTQVEPTCSLSWAAHSAFCDSISRSRSLRNSSCLASSSSWFQHNQTSSLGLPCLGSTDGNLSWCISHQGQPSLAIPLWSTHRVPASSGVKQRSHCCRVVGNTVLSHMACDFT